ncbi:phosphate starvation protein PhoH [Clostridia bacterium]|nr:phosphate starvation protein PhoH [Clostridia bacterium]
MLEKTIEINDINKITEIVGNSDKNLNILQKHYDVTILVRGSSLKIIGDNAEIASKALQIIAKMALNNEHISEQQIRNAVNLVSAGEENKLIELTDNICLTATGKVIKPKTLGQKQYIDAIAKNTIVLGIGPAGTGKTYLAVAMAVKAFRAKQVQKIILTRPAVEAGENLGFLPGDLQDKIDPYLRPLYDALLDMFGSEGFKRHMDRGTIEVAPLAYMRGRTLEDAFIILDEAQNSTNEQFKMFLTRLGNNSKMVITGDITQIDLPPSKKSGLLEATKILQDIDDLKFHRFSDKDVVRHKLVQDIINAYEKYHK